MSSRVEPKLRLLFATIVLVNVSSPMPPDAAAFLPGRSFAVDDEQVGKGGTCPRLQGNAGEVAGAAGRTALDLLQLGGRPVNVSRYRRRQQQRARQVDRSKSGLERHE